LKKRKIEIFLKLLMAAVWLGNGLFCKLLNLVPRHEEIVKEVLQTEWSREIVVAIGIGEIIIALWIMLDIKVRLHSFLQIFLVALMNILEFTRSPELLLWGKLNIIFAGVFIALVIYHLNLNSHAQT